MDAVTNSHPDTGSALRRSTPFFSDVGDVLWSITDKCNLDCIYCRAIPHDGTQSAEPTVSEVIHILNELGKLPQLESLIVSGGEAILSPHLPRVLAGAQLLARQVFLITNGTTLKADRQRDILLRFRPMVMCTIDSCDEAINQITRGPGVLAKSLATVGLLKNNLFVIVIIVLTRHNFDQLRSTCQKLYEAGVRNLLIQQLHCPDAASRQFFLTNSPTLKQIKGLLLMIDDIRSDFPDFQIDNNEVCFFLSRPDAKARLCNPEKEYWPQRLLRCGAGRKFFAIKTNGDVVPCNAFLDSVAGNLHHESLENIFESSRVIAGLREISEHRVSVVPGCGTCHLNPVCDGGCRADVLNLTGEIASNHPHCPYRADA